MEFPLECLLPNKTHEQENSMGLVIVAFYTLCDDLLIEQQYQDDPRTQMSIAEVMTIALVAAQLFGGNQQMARCFVKAQGYIPNMLSKARFNRRLHQIAPMFQTLFNSIAIGCKAQNPNQLYAIDSYPVPVCDPIRISGAKRYQGEVWRGRIASKRRYFYGLKLHLMVTESGVPVEFFLTPGSFGDVLRLRCYPFDLPQGTVVYADKAYCNYGIEDALAEAGITLKPLRKNNSKRQYQGYEVYLHHHYRKRIEVTNSLITQRLPRSIHAGTAAGFEIKIILFLIATTVTLIIK